MRLKRIKLNEEKSLRLFLEISWCVYNIALNYLLCVFVCEMLLQAAYSIEIFLVDFRCRCSQDAISI